MILGHLDEALSSGATLRRSCELLGLSARTTHRWRLHDGGYRRRGPSEAPSNKLSSTEESRILEVVASSEFCELSPKQIVPTLADRGEYVASESSFYRTMAKHNLQHHRVPTRPPAPRPKALTMTGPDQVYSWDISYLRSPVTGVFFYLYMVVDVWSRMIVAAEVHDVELDELAIQMIERACAEGMISSSGSWLHSDNGGPMKSGHMLAALRKLGIKPSFSRPRVSDDNPFSESLFRTLKYRPSYPKSFRSLAEARVWVEGFVTWYNTEHLHSGISHDARTRGGSVAPQGAEGRGRGGLVRDRPGPGAAAAHELEHRQDRGHAAKSRELRQRSEGSDHPSMGDRRR